jgi:hypothetical protein
MDQTKLATQITGFYRKTFDNSLEAIATIQDETEKMVNNSMVQSPWIPQEGKKFVTDWLKAYRKGSDDFMAATKDQYEKFGAYFNLEKLYDAAETSVKGKAAKNN